MPPRPGWTYQEIWHAFFMRPCIGLMNRHRAIVSSPAFGEPCIAGWQSRLNRFSEFGQPLKGLCSDRSEEVTLRGRTGKGAQHFSFQDVHGKDELDNRTRRAPIVKMAGERVVPEVLEDIHLETLRRRRAFDLTFQTTVRTLNIARHHSPPPASVSGITVPWFAPAEMNCA
jgi:hypothetical protein